MNRKRAMMSLVRVLLCVGLLLGVAHEAGAQTVPTDQTGFLGLAGIIRNQQNNPTNGITVKFYNSSTKRTEIATSGSQTGSTTGFYFVALTDFSGNRAAKKDDVLAITCWQGPLQLGVTPSTYTVTQADVDASLRKDLNLVTGVNINDVTPPEVRLSYSNTGTVAPASTLYITGTFSEAVSGTIKFSVQGPTGAASDLPASAVGGSTTTFSATLTVPSTTGNYTVVVSGAKDTANNANNPATNSTFYVGSTAPTGPVLSVGTASAAVGGQGSVTISMSPNGKTLGAINFKVAYPADKLLFKGIATGSAALSAGYSAGVGELTTGVLAVTVYGITEQALGAGPVALLTFEVKGGTTPAILTLAGSEFVASDLIGSDIQGETITNGSFTVIQQQVQGGCEDVNRSGAVDSVDLQRVVAVILGRRVQTTEDVNLSGAVDSVDLQRIVAVILGRRTAGVCP